MALSTACNVLLDMCYTLCFFKLHKTILYNEIMHIGEYNIGEYNTKNIYFQYI